MGIRSDMAFVLRFEASAKKAASIAETCCRGYFRRLSGGCKECSWRGEGEWELGNRRGKTGGPRGLSVFASVAGQVQQAAAGFAEDKLHQVQLVLHVERDLLA